MPTMTNFDPFVDPLPSEVHLVNAPLARVIAQVRFPELLSVGKDEFVAPFQEEIRDAYPVLRQEQIIAVQIGPQGVTQTPKVAWRFHDLDEKWRVTLTPDFLALETINYGTRTDFLQRLEVLTNALIQHMRPRLIDRLGIRYIDRLKGDAVQKVPELLRPEVSGIGGTVLNQHVKQVITESVFELPEENIITRWGYLPEQWTYDPAGIEPLDEKTWVLDIDMFSTGSIGIDAEAVREKARYYSERLYCIFRWAVQDRFLEYYGSQS